MEDSIIPDNEQVEDSPPLTPTLVNTIQTLDHPLVHPGGIPSAELQAAMREDETLQAWRAKADESLDGFYWDDGLLMKTITRNLEEQRELLIMRHEFWPRLLKTAHDGQGHLGVKKVKAALLRRMFGPCYIRTWSSGVSAVIRVSATIRTRHPKLSRWRTRCLRCLSRR